MYQSTKQTTITERQPERSHKRFIAVADSTLSQLMKNRDYTHDFESLRKGTEDHTQQEREKPVMGDVVHAPSDHKHRQNQVCPSWELI